MHQTQLDSVDRLPRLPRLPRLLLTLLPVQHTTVTRTHVVVPGVHMRIGRGIITNVWHNPYWRMQVRQTQLDSVDRLPRLPRLRLLRVVLALHIMVTKQPAVLRTDVPTLLETIALPKQVLLGIRTCALCPPSNPQTEPPF